MEPSPSLRVVRGPDWSWGDQDGGEGGVGTVVEVGKEGKSVLVQWDCGIRAWYRSGAEDKFDLRVFDTAPTGLKFPEVICCGCYVEGMAGMYWKCAHCYEYHLCHSCYQLGRHCQEHPFFRIQSKKQLEKQSLRVKVPPRLDSKRVEAKGIFSGAEVVRGPTWKFKDQDGGAGMTGKVIAIEGWKDETARSVVKVQWSATGKTNIYRVGHRGKCDLMCKAPGISGSYYSEHMPILGSQARVPQWREDDIVTGDIVYVELDPETFKMIHESCNLWADELSGVIGEPGTVIGVVDNQKVHINFSNNTYLISCLTLTKIEHCKVGEVVRVIDDIAEVHSLQQNHGMWTDNMALSLGQVGCITRVLDVGTVEVSVNEDIWIFNPLCLVPAPGEKPSSLLSKRTALRNHESNTEIRTPIMSEWRQKASNIAPALEGDIVTLKGILDSRVLKQSTKDALVAFYASSRQLSALRMILEDGGNPNAMGDVETTPLIIAISLELVDMVQVLVDAGADVNFKCKGTTPLILSAKRGYHRIVKILVNHPDINLNIFDDGGETALHAAVRYYNYLCMAYLLAAGADPRILNFRGNSVVSLAARTGRFLALELLVADAPEVVSDKNSDSHTPLHCAALFDLLPILTLLCTHGDRVDINCRTDQQMTPLHLAVARGHPRAVEYLVGYGADVDSIDNNGNSALHYATIETSIKVPSDDSPYLKKLHEELCEAANGRPVHGFVTVCCFLVQEGADIHLKNEMGLTPFQNLTPEAAALITKHSKSHATTFRGSLCERYKHRRNELPCQLGKRQITMQSSKSDVLPAVTQHTTHSAYGVRVEENHRQTLNAGQGCTNETTAETSQGQQPEKQQQMCMLCEEHPACVKFSPCGHTVLCSGCAERATKCYLCMVAVESKTVTE